jgi:hypothetical protein
MSLRAGGVVAIKPDAGTIEPRKRTLLSPVSWRSAIVLAAWFGLWVSKDSRGTA